MFVYDPEYACNCAAVGSGDSAFIDTSSHIDIAGEECGWNWNWNWNRFGVGVGVVVAAWYVLGF